jgi:hypothetical protein
MVSFLQSYHGARGPEKRKDRRLPLPIFLVTIDGEACESLNWSLSGLLVRDYAGMRNVGEDVLVEVLGRDGDTEMRVSIDAKVVRRSENGQFAVQFAAMSPPIFEFFERCFSARFKKRS